MSYLVFFDSETDSLREDCQIIQLAAIAVDADWNECDVFERKVQFDASKSDAKALEINRYDPAIWRDQAEPEGAVVKAFAEFLNTYRSIEMVSKRSGNPYSVARLAGHNAASFDGPRLQAMFKRHEAFLPAHPQVMCTLQAALWEVVRRGMKVESLRLESICKSFGVELPEKGFHDALYDCRASIGLAKAILCPVPVEVAW